MATKIYTGTNEHDGRLVHDSEAGKDILEKAAKAADNGRPKTRVINKPPYVGLIDGRFLDGLVSEKVTEIDENIIKDVWGMTEALKWGYSNGFQNGRRGLALAHCQVNMRPYAFFVVLDIDGARGGAYFNPEIIGHEGRGHRSKDELCLSFPFASKARVERKERIHGRWQEIEEKDGKLVLSEPKEAWFDGKMAQIWQHEMEHLMGLTIYGSRTLWG